MPTFARRRAPPPHASSAAQALLVALLLGLLLTLLLPRTVASHEVPARVALRLFVAVEPTGVRVLARAPLEAMRDIDFPLRGQGSLDFGRAAPFVREAATLWVADGLALELDGVRLPRPTVVAARASLPSDPAFATLAAARARLAGPPEPPDTDLPWQQALLDSELFYALDSASAARAATGALTVVPRLAHLGVRTSTVLTFVPASGAPRIFTYEGDPGRVTLDPSLLAASARFVALGVEHIVIGLDHLLFLLCLVLPFRRLRPLVAIVTAFTVAHSLTLMAAALGWAPEGDWFPPLVETLIAASIVLMAVENILGARLDRRWMVAFGFGLVHGFGFSFALRESLQFAGQHVLPSLVAFNLGVELGQVALVALAVPVLTWALARIPSERTGVIVLSAFVAHEAWHWTTSRGAELSAYEFAWPAMDAFFWASVLQGVAGGALAVAIAGAMGGVMRRLVGDPPRPGAGRRQTDGLETVAGEEVGAR